MSVINRISEKDIADIVEKRSNGMTYTDISREYGVSRRTITQKLKKANVYENKPTVKRCEYCGNTFKTNKYNNHIKRYCSDKCKCYSNRQLKLIYDNCINCKILFIKRNEQVDCCSENCKEKVRKRKSNRRRKLKIYKFECLECGYRGHSKSKKVYCSNECSSKCYNRKRKFKQRKFKKCDYCDDWHYKSKLFCSETCSEKHSKRKRYSYKGKRMIRARQNGQFDADIDVYKLIERDGEQCYLCGDAVSFCSNYNDAKYPTIEHVIAIANGGTHSWDNVKVACRDCNNKKGVKVVDTILEGGITIG